MKLAAKIFVVLAIQLPAVTAFAQAKGISEQKPVSTGTTDVAKEGFAKVEEDKEKDKKEKDATELQIAAGGLFSTGNAKAISVTASSKGRLRRGDHQGAFAIAGNSAATPEKKEDGTTGPMKETVRNIQGLARYDYFLTPEFSIFFQASVRHDKFQFLDLRLNLDPGVAYQFVNKKERRVWGELGGDVQVDWRNPPAIRDQNVEKAAKGEELLETRETRVNARAFFGYEEKASKEVGFNSGVEYLQGLTDPSWFRLNVDLGVKSQFSDKFSFATTFTLRYESEPVAKEKLDVIGAVNLVYSLY